MMKQKLSEMFNLKWIRAYRGNIRDSEWIEEDDEESGESSNRN